LLVAYGFALLVAAFVGLGGCASSEKHEEVQRATEGPTAAEVFSSRFQDGYGRAPTFDESMAFRIDLDERVADYMTKHPELGTSPRASQFTFQRRVTIGMTKEEVLLLVGKPSDATPDEEQMREGARQFWPSIKEHAAEMWIYPGGWHFYFQADRLVDLTVVGKPPL